MIMYAHAHLIHAHPEDNNNTVRVSFPCSIGLISLKYQLNYRLN